MIETALCSNSFQWKKVLFRSAFVDLAVSDKKKRHIYMTTVVQKSKERVLFPGSLWKLCDRTTTTAFRTS